MKFNKKFLTDLKKEVFEKGISILPPELEYIDLHILEKEGLKLNFERGRYYSVIPFKKSEKFQRVSPKNYF